MMKTINIISKTALIAGLVCLASCNDYLVTYPSDSLESETAITTPEDTKTALNGAYAGLISARDAAGNNYYYYGTDFLARAEVGEMICKPQSLVTVQNNIIALPIARQTPRRIYGILLYRY